MSNNLAKLDNARLETGNIDGIFASRHLHGWLYRNGAPSTKTEADILIDQHFIGTVCPNQFRQDLRDAGYGNGNHAFSIELPEVFLDGTNHIVAVCQRNKHTEPPICSRRVYFPKLTQSARRHNLAIASAVQPIWRSKSPEILIIGSAPTVTNYREAIGSFAGEVWALNDAVFWCQLNGIKVDRFFVADARFVWKNKLKLRTLQDMSLIVMEKIFDESIFHPNNEVYLLRSLGRDGFSQKFGSVFHGCSVLFPALQCAVAQRYKSIKTCGVLLHPPLNYARIDGTGSLPEYVHLTQLNNARRALNALRARMIRFSTFEPNSRVETHS